MVNKIKNHYYTYVPGEFFPIMSGSELLNKREFNRYKLRRALWKIKNPRVVVYHWTHQRG